jgi:hypothetical protein
MTKLGLVEMTRKKIEVPLRDVIKSRDGIIERS